MEKDKKNKPDLFGKNGNGKIFKPNLNWLFAIIFFVLIAVNFLGDDVNTKTVSYSQFEQYISTNAFEKVTIVTNKNLVKADVRKEAIQTIFNKKELKSSQKGVVETNIPSVDETSKMLKERGFKGDVKYAEENDLFQTILISFGPIILLVVLWVFLMRRMGGGSGGGGVFSVGKSKAQLFDKNSTTIKITFKDVAGLAEAKQEIEEIVSFLKNPSKYTELGGKIPKGALLVGPPGTGKTLLAKAVAGEADVPFFSMSGSDFVEMFVGVGASRVRDLFRQAKEKAPCIIFIDEIDAVGRARGKNPNMGANDERENTLNQLLTEMDGFGTNSGVIILAATNRADILDKALLRAGRFDRQIHVGLPDIQERKEIFNVHLRPLKIGTDLDVDFLAKQTPGFSGADIANVCNESALIAARKNKSVVEKQDFLDAVDRIVGGLEKRTKIITTGEKKSIAYHEAGHATISWLIEYAAPLVKVTIVPRGEALGAAWYLPEERVLTNREHMLDEMCATLGGRAAEEVFFGTPSTGAISDLERVTKRAYAMVAFFGMSKEISNISFYDSSGANEYGFTKPYSEKTAELIDSEAKKIVQEQYERAKKILIDHRKEHNELAGLLIEKEVIFIEDLERVFGKRPWTSRADELLLDSEESEKKIKPEEETTNLENPELENTETEPSAEA
ncbi:MAG: ATP-dependent zinc metalloprotease FtsH [Paludibacteraceae bacterium]|nr:ATP-dependent zinc metalloprotease FtsH [Paludibacteraceae bacterium]